MADEKKKILIDVVVGATQSIKDTRILVDEVTELKKAQKELDTTTAEGKEEFEAYGSIIRKVNKDVRDQRKYTDNLVTSMEAEDGSLTQLKASLSNMTAVYGNMSKAQRKSAEGKELRDSILEVTDTLKEAEQEIGNYRRSVGQYQNAMLGAIAGNNKFAGSILEMSATGGSATGMLKQMGNQASIAGKTLLALAANPVVSTLAAIVAVCALVSKAFQRNEDNADKLNIVIAKVGGVFEWLLKILEPVAEFLVDGLVFAFDILVKQIETTINGLSAILDFLGLDTASKWVKDITNDINKMSEASGKLAKAEAELRKEQRESTKIQKDYQRQAEKLRQLRDDDTKSISERIKANEDLGKVLQQQQEAELAIANKALEVANLKLEVEGRTTANLDAHALALEKIADIQERMTGVSSEQIKNESSLRKEASDKALESFNKTLDAKKTLDEALLRAEGDYQSEDYSKRQEYERKIFSINDNTEREKLNTLRKFGKITQSEYDTQLDILDAKQKEFNNSQVKGLNDYFKEQMKEISSMVEQSTTQQIADVTEKYDKAIKDLQDIEEPIQLIGQSDADFEKEYGKYKALMLEKALLEVELERQKVKDIETINEASLQKRLSEIEKAVSKQYQTDLDKFVDNEREKNLVEIDSINESIKRKKDAGLSTLADEAQLRALTSQANQIQLNTELLQANQNAEARYRSKKVFLEKEKELYKDNADKQIEINEKLKENDKELIDARMEGFAKWRDATTALFSSLNDLSRANSDAAIQEFENENENKKRILQDRFDQGLISQKEFDDEVANADAELNRKKRAEERKQAERERLMKVFQITTDTAMGIAKAVSMAPLTFGLPWSAFVGATGAIQLASVMSAPLPKASKGMLLSGPSHAQGGIPIEAEGGEAIINKRSTAMFAPLLSLINEVGGGVPFAKPMADGGFSVRNNQGSKNDWVTKSEMLDIIGKQKIYVTVEDYRRADTKYADIKDISRNE